MNKELEFSVILPVGHGGGFLRDALASLRRIDFPPDRFEVLVVGPEDDEESKRIVKAESANTGYDIIYIRSARDQLAARLNVACVAARGSILSFADDDCLIIPDWLRKISSVLQHDPNIGAVGGQDILEQGSSFDLALDFTLNSFFGTGGIRRGTGLRAGKYYPRLWNMAIPRRIAEEVALRTEGGMAQIFDESLIIHEDVDLMNRIEKSGRLIVFLPDLLMKHRRDTTLWSFTKRNFDIARTCRSLGVHRLPHRALAIFVFSILTLLLASIFYVPLRVILLLYTGIYMVPLLATSLGGLRRTKRLIVFITIPLLLMSLHFSRGLGYLLPWRNKRAEVNS